MACKGCWLIVLVLCLACIPVRAKGTPQCRFAKKATTHGLPSGFKLSLFPINGQYGEGCRAKLVDVRKKVIFSVADWDIGLVVSGQDVNGDGLPDIVLEGYSGGAHCCWTYYIFSLGPNPKLLGKFKNEQGAEFVVNNGTGRMEIHALDGAFDYFEFPHAFSPFPDVYLRIEGQRFLDVSRDHLKDYDQKIAKLKAKIPVKDLAVFLQVENREEIIGWENVSKNVLEIVLAYLYSGRPTQAHVTLKKMWPAFDQNRIWKLILETRRQGILRYARQKAS